MKKFLIHVFLILTAFVIYFLQADFFSWFTIAGVMPNLFIFFILFIGLFGSKTMGTTYGIAIGMIIDFLFRSKIGITAVALGIIGFLATIFDKNFSKDSRMTIMVMVAGSTILYEGIEYLLNYIVYSSSVEIVYFLKILTIEVIYNITLTIILYPLIQKCGYAMENELKGNKILTRYF